ncbi:MAG: hypothetical protein HY096_15240 [Nitrospinae bacterium]|nr:hypothetical protein [Nitrospinota bacterium]
MFILFLRLTILFLISIIFSGCATGRYSHFPYTSLPLSNLAIEDEIKNLKIAVVLFDIEDTKISGGHYKGMMQKIQHWDINIPEGQKDSFLLGLSETVSHSIADEFLRQGLNVIVTDGKDINRLKGLDIIVTGKVSQIELNAYANDYWEAVIILKDITLYRTRDEAMMWIGDIERYCKLPDSPEKLDGAMFKAVSKFLKTSIEEKSYEDYFQKRKDITPAEIAARLSAIDIIKKINSDSFITSK